MIIRNNRSEGEVTVDVYFELDEQSVKVSSQLKPNETFDLKLNQPAVYAVEIYGATKGDYVVEEGQFDCNSKRHRIWITEKDIESQLELTTLVCHTPTETSG